MTNQENFNPNKDIIPNIPLYRFNEEIKSEILNAVQFNYSHNLTVNESLKLRVQKALIEPYAMTYDLSKNQELKKESINSNPSEETNNNKIVNGDIAFSKVLDSMIDKNKNNPEISQILNKIKESYNMLIKDAINGR